MTSRGRRIFFAIAAFSFVQVSCTDETLVAPEDPVDAADANAPQQDTSRDPDTGGVPDAATDAIDPCGVCCPGDARCGADGTRQICRQDGSGYDAQTCPGEQTCRDGVCADPPVCQPGETMCNDETLRLVCRATGESWRPDPCSDGQSCVDGACVSGARVGALCAADDECAAGLCRCGSSSEPTCAAALSPGFCSASCSTNGCGDGNVCVVASVFTPPGVDPSDDFCAPSCAGSCTLPGFSCVSVASRDEEGGGWRQACFFDGLRGLGELCTRDSECVGGTCLTEWIRDGFCTARCEEVGCPNGFACVQLESEFHCSPLCGDGSIGGTETCAIGGGSRRDTGCGLRQTHRAHGGELKRVCISNL